ncbi:hypothetical protein EV138_0368 [Kribbella voronezhensis]|uniref:Uncharacterized protein n=1 Tax=Kribbella voronezhensis TaxID=2512212 RepID=A0A4R7T4V5_9ACTN|nr:hypothetical protein [Kribbella voronezhensis]TDU86852.1 hypothetical protein EV138_0368 [Kribbella voronezhensis]
MWWNKQPKCPVRTEEQLWIEEWLDWLANEFGTEILQRPVVLPEPAFFPSGYGLARYAWLRGESAPDWASHLDTNPRVYLRDGLRFIAAG